MRVTRLALTNFRSYKNLELEFSSGPTTFIGNNGSGKTNIAESLIYLAYLSSHRVSNNQPLISLGADQAIIRAEIESQGRTLQVDLEINANKANRARLNGNAVKSQREILGALQIIYFSPEDLDLVRGEPTHRRDFLDKLLITQSPSCRWRSSRWGPINETPRSCSWRATSNWRAVIISTLCSISADKLSVDDL